MRKLIILISLILSLTSKGQLLQNLKSGYTFTPVIVIAGQSNADGGNNDVANITTAFKGQTSNFIKIRDLPLMTLNAEEATTEHSAQEYGLTYYMSTYMNKPVYIVKYGVGNTRLTVNGSEWNSNGGAYYNALMRALDTTLRITLAGKNPKVVSIVWHQGESDAIAQVAQATYETALTALITAWRASSLNTYFIGVNNVNVQIMRIHNTWQSAYPSATINNIRAAEASVASAMINVQLINTDDLPLKTSDPIHISTPGQCTLSARTFDNIKNIK